MGVRSFARRVAGTNVQGRAVYTLNDPSGIDTQTIRDTIGAGNGIAFRMAVLSYDHEGGAVHDFALRCKAITL